MTGLYVLGGGGHAKVVIDAARAIGDNVGGVFDDNPVRHGTDVLGVPVLGSMTDVLLAHHDVRRAVIAIGNNRVRQQVVRRFDHMVHWETIVHPGAVVAQDVVLGEGTIVCAGAIVQPATTIGAHVILNTACSVDHDCQVADFTHLAPGCHIAGAVRIGEGTLVGIGAAIVPERTVGSWVTVGAGAVVVRDVPDGVIAKGVPAHHA